MMFFIKEFVLQCPFFYGPLLIAFIGFLLVCIFRVPRWILMWRLRNRDIDLSHLDGLSVAVIDRVNALVPKLRSLSSHRPRVICEVRETGSGTNLHLMVRRDGVLCVSFYVDGQINTQLLSNLAIHFLVKYASKP